MDYLSARNIGYLSQEMISYVSDVSDVSYKIKELSYAESIITFWV